MTSSESDGKAAATNRGDVCFAFAGPGSVSLWECARCLKRKGSMLGRKKRRVRGVMQFVCADCSSKGASK